MRPSTRRMVALAISVGFLLLVGGAMATSPLGIIQPTVKTGALRLIYGNDRSCNGTLYVAGDSFVDRGDENVHIALNEAVGNTELWATYLMPGAPTVPPAAFRLDAVDPGPPDSCNPDDDDEDEDD